MIQILGFLNSSILRIYLHADASSEFEELS
jgi:hypothetical protein